MTDYQPEARKRINDVATVRGAGRPWTEQHTRETHYTIEAMCRLMEEHAAFRREVSEFAIGVKAYMRSRGCMAWQDECDQFILPAPDPLADAAADLGVDRDKLAEVLAKRGLVGEAGE